MNGEAFREIWSARLQTTASELQRGSGAKAVLVALFQTPWEGKKETGLLGLEATRDVDVFAVARELRFMADTLERKAGQLSQAEPFMETVRIPKPVRQ